MMLHSKQSFWNKVEVSDCYFTIPTGSEEREVLGVESIPVAKILPSCQDMKILHYNCINRCI